jgi:hypothetical protein
MFTPVRRCTNGKGNEASLLHPEHCVPKVTNTWGWGYTHSCCHLGQQHMHTFFPEPSLCFLAHPLGWTDVSPLEDCKFHLWRTDVLAQKTGAGHMCMGPLELWLLLVQDLWDVWCHPVGPLVPPHGPKVLPCEQPLHVVLQPLPLGFPQHKPQPHFSSWAVSPTLASHSALMCGRKVPWRQQRQGQQCVYCNRFSCGSSMQKGLQHLCAHVCMLRPAAWTAASVQQPLSSSFQLKGPQRLSCLKEGVQRHGSSTTSGEATEAWTPGAKWVIAWQHTGTTGALPSGDLCNSPVPWQQW